MSSLTASSGPVVPLTTCRDSCLWWCLLFFPHAPYMHRTAPRAAEDGDHGYTLRIVPIQGLDFWRHTYYVPQMVKVGMPLRP